MIPSQMSSRSSWMRTARRMAFGIVTALVACELALRTITTPYAPWWEMAPIDSDRTDGRGETTVRSYHEGFATSHFSNADARLTGNPFVAGAPVGVILGGSFVRAVQVNDGETMGADVEALARSSGAALNVRQY